MNNAKWKRCISEALCIVEKYESKSENKIWTKVEITPEYINLWFHESSNVLPKLFNIDKEIEFKKAKGIFERAYNFMNNKNADMGDVDKI